LQHEKIKTWMPAPVFAFGFDPAQQVGALKLLSEGGQAQA
jgi:hypothetical protein